MSFKSILGHVGHFLVEVFHDAEKAAVIAEPFVSRGFPDIAPLYHTALTTAMSVEAIAQAAGAGAGSGATKLALAFSQIEPQVKAFFTANNMPYDQAAATSWLSAVVDSLNKLPAPLTLDAAANSGVVQPLRPNATV